MEIYDSWKLILLTDPLSSSTSAANEKHSCDTRMSHDQGRLKRSSAIGGN